MTVVPLETMANKSIPKKPTKLGKKRATKKKAETTKRMSRAEKDRMIDEREVSQPALVVISMGREEDKELLELRLSAMDPDPPSGAPAVRSSGQRTEARVRDHDGR